jgi:hypothetical protein
MRRTYFDPEEPEPLNSGNFIERMGMVADLAAHAEERDYFPDDNSKREGYLLALQEVLDILNKGEEP